MNKDIQEYMSSLVDVSDPYSGEERLLEGALFEKFAKTEDLALNIYAVKSSGMIHPDDFNHMKKEYRYALAEYRQALLNALPEDYKEKYAQEILQKQIFNQAYMFHTKEGADIHPLYAEVTVQWKEDKTLENAIIKLTPDRDEEGVLYNANGIEGLKELTRPDNREDFTVVCVKEIFGREYNIDILEYLIRDVNISADSRREAIQQTEKAIRNEEIVLDADDFSYREILFDEEPKQPKRNIYATPDCSIYPISVVEVLQRSQLVDAVSETDAKLKVQRMLDEERIVLGEDDLQQRDLLSHITVYDDRIKEPQQIEIVDVEDFNKKLLEKNPNGLTVTINKQSVATLLAIDKIQQFSGLLNSPCSSTELTDFGTLETKIILEPEDYELIMPDRHKYTHPEIEYDHGHLITATTLYMHEHPDMNGGLLKVYNNTQILDKVYVEGLPLREVQNMAKERNITKDSDLETVIYLKIIELERARRISDISVYKDNNDRLYVRCKIDGEQQSGKRLEPFVAKYYREGGISKETLAETYFKKELRASKQEQEQNRSMHR